MNTVYAENERADDCRANARSPGVLIVDDAAYIRTLLKFEMESRGFHVWLAVDGDDALDLYRRHRTQIDVVILDVQMPGLDGPQTLEALQRLNRNVVACFMSGDTGAYMTEELLARGAAMVFSKPFRAAIVADLLARLACAAEATPFVCDWEVPWIGEPTSQSRKGRWAPGPL